MIPPFPIHKPSEQDGMEDFLSLKKQSFLHLVEHKPWTSRSELDDKLCYPLVLAKSNIGNKSSNCFHWQARMACDSLTAPSPIRAWYDRKLRKNIEGSVYYQDSHKSALTMRGYTASQFRPSAAKALFEWLQAKDVYDPCGGWGDRLSAALASKLDSYHCRDLNPLVFAGYALQQQSYISTTQTSFEYRGAEVDCPKANAFDLVFTSPPYWKVEKYQGENQSFRQYKKFDEWMEGFLYPMATHSWEALKDEGFMAINISDCYANHTYNRICMPLLDYCMNNLPNCSFAGFMGYEITPRKNGGPNAEPIVLFSKNKSINLHDLAPAKPQGDLFDAT